MPEPFISIVVNNYNYARFLGAAIDSALAQNYTHREVVVVDDGSTDGSRAVIEAYGKRVIPIYRENGGQGAAFNSGFSASRGELVLFLDADDLLLPEALYRVAAVWRPDLAKVHYQLKILRGGQLTDELVVRTPLARGDVAECQLRGGGSPAPPTSGNAYARWALRALLPISEPRWRLCADAYLNALVPLLGPVQALDEPLGVYRVHGANNWYRDDLDLNTCWERAVEQSVRHLHLAEVVGRVRGERARARWLHTVGAIKTRMLLAFQGPEGSLALRWRLALAGLCSAPWAVHHSLPKRALIALWFVLAGVAPPPVQRFLAMQAMCPAARPRFVQKL